MDSSILLRPARDDDAVKIAEIYNHYVLQTVVTFETSAVSAAEMAGRMREIQARGLPWLVAEADGTVIGYAYAAPWRARHAYRFAVETTIYLEKDRGGAGVGSRLYARLIESLRQARIHCAIGGIALPNPASVALHEKLGFVKVAQFREVGFKHEQWIDTGYWQLLLDDRSRYSGGRVS